ncbi:endoribonuclease LACTB2 [Hyalella azteca]|uniref:Beta-lactamase-like protein 2 homolog n=1 Tax=Hyalella azteca TaxID=294128 RepID=A0A8B7PL50_HYAAZ|nr:endoribonuclease LACTB2 [Hyalella azteca]
MLSKIPAVERLSARIIRILGCNPGPMTLQGTNTYLVGTGKRRLLVDAGEQDNKAYISSLINVLKEQEAEISDVIITHWHQDHLGGLCDVLNATNKSALVHQFPYPDTAPYDPLPDWVNLKALNHLDQVSVPGATLRVHYTPGHTPDHVCLEVVGGEDDGALFTGDCVLGESTAVFEDLYDYMNSLKILLSVSKGTLYPGHGEVITNGAERVQQYIDHRNAREQQIFETLLAMPNSTSTASELVKIVYKDTPSRLHMAAECNLRLHLGKLVKDGRVRCIDDTFSVVASNKL